VRDVPSGGGYLFEGIQAEDIAMDTWARIMHFRDNFDPDRHGAATYLYKTARHCYADVKRRYVQEKDIRSASLDFLDSSCTLIRSRISSSVSHTHKRYTTVDSCLNLLNERERTLILRVQAFGDKLKDVALDLEISNNNARVILHRTIKKIQQLLLQDDKNE